MKNILLVALGSAAMLVCSCGKYSLPNENDSEIRRVESWVIYQKSLHSDYLWKETPLGCYILKDEEGTGAAIGDAATSPYVLVTYTATDLDGNILDSSEEEIARQLGQYKKYNYYGPSIIARGEGSSFAGEDEVLSGMRIGGTRTALVPAWLLTNKRYKDAEGYRQNAIGGISAIYTFHIEDSFTNVFDWQIKNIENYIKTNYPEAVIDTTGKYGFYYYQITPPDDPDEVINTGDKLSLNYTGKLLNGTVFDTTDEITGKDAGLNRTSYESTYIVKADTYTNTTMGDAGSTIIDGFAYAVDKMKHGEKGVAIFYSPWGYGAQSSGASIPPYSPLIFELEMVHKNQEKN